MSKNVVRNQTRNQLTVDTDLTKTFLYNNRFNYDTFYFNNATSGDVSIPEGTVLGRVTSAGPTQGFLVEWTSGASDGSQYPVGVLQGDVYVAYGEVFQQKVSYCVAGDVDQNKIVLQGSDTLNTVVQGRQLQDWLGSVNASIRLKDSDQHTSFDN